MKVVERCESEDERRLSALDAELELRRERGDRRVDVVAIDTPRATLRQRRAVMSSARGPRAEVAEDRDREGPGVGDRLTVRSLSEVDLEARISSHGVVVVDGQLTSSPA